MVLEQPEIPLPPTVRKTTFAVRSRGARSAPDAKRHRPGLPRCFPQSRQDLRQARHRGLDYLGSRFKIVGHAIIEPLDHYVRAGCARLIGAGTNILFVSFT